MAEVQAQAAGLIEAVENELKKRKNPFTNKALTVVNQGTQIVLPGDPRQMTLEEGIECLQRKLKEESTPVQIREEVQGYPLDGAFAFMKALQRRYGWAQPVPTPGFFGPKPPTTVSIEIGFEKYTQLIWGSFEVPGIKGRLQTGADWNTNPPKFIIAGEVLKRHQEEIKQIAEETRAILRAESVYRGHAITLTLDGDGEMTQEAPKFLDLRRVNPDELTFSDELAEQVETSLFTPIEKTRQCRAHQIPLKRGVLLEGPYGTGKTLTAFVTAQKCVENGWTFIMVPRVHALDEALKFAKLYQPAVVFAEDIDRAISGENRTVEIDDILNTIDGIGAKGTEIITILTSNHVENLNTAMLRPGRLDAVLSIQAPNAQAVIKLVRIYGRGLIDEKENLKAAGVELAGQIPAVIREVLERAKLYAISRLPDGEEFVKLKCSDIVASAKGMKHHLSLLKPKVVEKSVEEQAGDAIGKLVKTTIYGNGMFEKITKIEQAVV